MQTLVSGHFADPNEVQRTVGQGWRIPVFFLDTASLTEIAKWREFGLVGGVTTNPALLSSEGREPLDQLREITRLVNGPVSAQVTSSVLDSMIAQGRALSRVAQNIVVKVPATREGYLAAKALVAEGIACNITLTFDPMQAIPFCRLPATYVSLIIGRVEDFGLRSAELVGQLRAVLDRLESPTRLLAASIRNSHHLAAALTGGADVITVPPSTWANIYKNPLTLSGEQDFFQSWRNLPAQLRERYEQLGVDGSEWQPLGASTRAPHASPLHSDGSWGDSF